MTSLLKTSIIDGLGSNGFASISSELLEVLKDNLDVGKYSVVTKGMNGCIEDAELLIVDDLPDDVENLLINIVW